MASDTASVEAMGPTDFAAKSAIRMADMVVGSFKRMAESMEDFIAKSNPALFARLSIASENLAAAIGKLLEPLGMALLPIINDLNAGFTEMAVEMKGMLSQVGELAVAFSEFSKTISPLNDALQSINPSTIELAAGMQIAKTEIEVVTAALQALGLIPKKQEKTVAAGTAGFAGMEDIGKQFREAGLKSGGAEDVQGKIQDDVSGIKGMLGDLVKHFTNELPNKEAIKGGVEKAGEEIGGPAGAIIQWAGGLF